MRVRGTEGGYLRVMQPRPRLSRELRLPVVAGCVKFGGFPSSQIIRTHYGKALRVSTTKVTVVDYMKAATKLTVFTQHLQVNKTKKHYLKGRASPIKPCPGRCQAHMSSFTCYLCGGMTTCCSREQATGAGWPPQQLPLGPGSGAKVSSTSLN